MRFLLVDRVLSWEPDKRMTGVKNVTMSEDFLEFHFPRYPVMPGVMLLEALAQVAGWLTAASSDFEHWALLEHVRTSKFYGFALPGDQVQLEVEAAASDDPETRVFRCAARVDGELRARAELEMRLVPMIEIESPQEQRLLFKVLTREMVYFATERNRKRK